MITEIRYKYYSLFLYLMISRPFQIPVIIGYVFKHSLKILYYDWRGHLPKTNYRHAFNLAHEVLRAFEVKVHTSGKISKGPAIICTNHTSMADIPAILAIPGKKYFAPKTELFIYPFMGRAMRAIGLPEIDRKKGKKAMKNLEDALNNITDKDQYLVMYPEGTRTKSDNYMMKEFKYGAFVLSKRTGLPIIPIASYGGREIHKKKQLNINPGNMYLSILEALQPGDYNKINDLLIDTRVRLEDEIERLKGYAEKFQS